MADILGAVGSALGLTKGGEIAPLTIESYTDIERKQNKLVFEAFINPDEYSLSYNVIADSNPAPGTNGTAGTFIGTQPLEVTLKFFIDGTNVLPEKKTGNRVDVPAKIGEFNRAMGFEGESHRPRYLRLIWGNAAWLRSNQFSFDCYLKSATLQYKLFDSNGTPLRVIINATFTEALSAAESKATHPTSSPDLTHVRTVKEGDTLPGMTFKIYGDISYYLEVARVNKLTNFRNLKPGQKIIFPPFDKNASKK